MQRQDVGPEKNSRLLQSHYPIILPIAMHGYYASSNKIYFRKIDIYLEAKSITPSSIELQKSN